MSPLEEAECGLGSSPKSGSPFAAAIAAHSGPAAGAASAGAAASTAADADDRQRHYWERDVCPGLDSPQWQDVSYRGPGPLRRPLSQRPWLLASVHGTDHEGRPFHWLARRRRKCVAQPHECPALPPGLSWRGCLDLRRQAANLSWWVALAFTVGSVMFVVSGAAGLVMAVGHPERHPPGLTSLTAALIGWPNAIAANLFFASGGLLQLMETTRMGYHSQLAVWEKRGWLGPRPRWRGPLPSRHDLRTVSLWAVLIQISGMLGFNMATLAFLIDTAEMLPLNVRTWCIKFGFTYGGAAFTASSILFCWEATGSWWRGLVPSRLKDLRSISWHSVFWGFQGSVGFLISGAGSYAHGFSWSQMQAINGYGALGGAIWFLLSSLAMLLEQGNPHHL